MKKRRKTALLGTGFVGRVHLENLIRSGCAEVAALIAAPADLAQTRELAARFGIETVETDYRRVLENPSIDAIHICTPNSLHAVLAEEALRQGKHVLCEKPLATSAEEARGLAALAADKGLRNCTCYNLRFYPLVQQMRAMCADGELGEILAVQGTYSQDWLLQETDWNWRLDPKETGPSRTMSDIGSHWCDLAEFVTGLRITALCADLKIFHRTRRQPKGPVETYAGRMRPPEESSEVAVETEDFGAVVFRMGEQAGGSFTANQMAAGRKNHVRIEVYGTKKGMAWNGENPNELWIGSRNLPNQILLKDPSLLSADAARCAMLPGGHAEGYSDTFQQLFRNFYAAIEDAAVRPQYPQFVDGLRQLEIVDAELRSWRSRSWVDLPAGERT